MTRSEHEVAGVQNDVRGAGVGDCAVDLDGVGLDADVTRENRGSKADDVAGVLTSFDA